MRLWIGPAFCLLLLCPWILGNTECNAFSGTADKTSDAALLFQARQHIDQSKYSEALETIARMSTTGRNGRDGRLMEASAYAGRCGLNLVTFASNVAAGAASNPLMTLLLTEMKAATSYTDCASAETLLLGIPTASMTADDWVFLAFVAFAKIGAALEVGGLDSPAHSGTVIAGFDTCVAAAPLTNAIVADIGLSIAVAITAVSNSGISIGPSGINAICAAPISYPCTATSTTDISGSAVNMALVRTLIKTNEIGLNACGGSVTSGGLCIPCTP